MDVKLAGVVAWTLLFGLLAGCRERAEAPAPSAAPAAVPALPAPSAAPARPRLREDPIAAKRSTAQWQEHLEHEEEERQMWFDAERIPQHRAVAKLFAAARARYDRARTAPAVAKVRAEMPKKLDEIRARITQLDHWGNNSRLHPDYDALAAQLSGPYADARTAALAGDAKALQAERASFDAHLKTIDAWLEKVAAEDEEGEHEEGERKRPSHPDSAR